MIMAFTAWPAGRLLARDAPTTPSQKISAGELHKALSARFPARFGVAGVLQVDVSEPSLLLAPARNQLGAGLIARVSGVQLRQAHTGELDVAFSLRYEPSDKTVRAHRMEILDLRWPGLPRETVQALQRLLPAMARDAMGEVVLHRFTARELALPDAMGLEPENLTVVDDGLVISFAPKLRP
jgi:hypothetical protein